jgi:two-component system, chemotaxis family, protein-glutamate methylesterase/glutaminase
VPPDPPRAAPRRPAPLRVLAVDDSEASLRAIVGILRREADVQVVGQATDGEEALRLVLQLEPDCVCLDLEMPRMDGFTFLRLLMAKQPTPVIVVSSNARKQDVFKALELGALDFVAKPEKRDAGGDLADIRDDLVAKLAMVRALRVDSPASVPAPPAGPRPPPPATPRPPPLRGPEPPGRLVVIGASTGGPAALAQLLCALPTDLPLAYAVAQHMPERFTRAFAERLARSSGLDVREAEDGDELLHGRVLVAPGGRHLKVIRAGGALAPLRAALVPQNPRDGRRYCPSVDVLFESAADAMGDRVCAVVLTGMGNDGRRGVEKVKEAGGFAIAESEESAVVYGMPKEAAGTGKVDGVLSLEEMVSWLCRFAGVR